MACTRPYDAFTRLSGDASAGGLRLAMPEEGADPGTEDGAVGPELTSILDLLDPAERGRLVDELGEERAEGEVVSALARYRADIRLRRWRARAQQDADLFWAGQERFERSLASWPWGPGFTGLDHLIVVSGRAGVRHWRRGAADVKRDQDARWWALALLHRRALLVTSEVRALLRSGHASGALARWRTLYEVSVVAMFLQEHDDETAGRYLAHEAVQRANDLRGLMAAGDAFASSLPDEDQIREIFAEEKRLRRLYGKAFAQPYGWARNAFDKRKVPQLTDLERSLSWGHWRPYVNLAHGPIHAGAHALYFDIGVPDDWEVGPAGATNMGMLDPGQFTAISLAMCMTAWLTVRPDIESLADAIALGDLADLVSEAFATGAGELEESIRAEQEEKRRLRRERAAAKVASSDPSEAASSKRQGPPPPS
ncbi:MAG: DUF5677 domain-containing protein [Chloroflexota bacterium]